MHPQMTPYRVVIHRGGTSKAVFLKANELPADPAARDEVIRAIFGSPDRRQIDGLGGADVLTSKLAVVGPPTRPDADVDYTFAQVSFDTELVDYGGNCGNISAAVGPFAIDEGLVRPVEPVTRVRIHQTNTNCILVADVPVAGGKAAVLGDYAIDGVPGTGARILLDFHDTAGATLGHVLPTGNATDTVHVDGRDYEVSIVDAGNVHVFIEAASLGMKGTETCAEIDADRALSARIEAIRSTCTVKLGMAASRAEATARSAYVPFFAIVSPPADYVCAATGAAVAAGDVDIVSRLSFMLHMHKAYPGTGTVATGAAARIPGTLVHRQLDAAARGRSLLRIGHPSGVIEVDAEAEADCAPGESMFRRLAYGRTARRIMEGTCYVADSHLSGKQGGGRR